MEGSAIRNKAKGKGKSHIKEGFMGKYFDF
jgi:hypothetical protein